MFVALFRALLGLAYLEDKGLTHGDLSPCSVCISGRLLDYLHINRLVSIAQGTKPLIYDAPENCKNLDIWSLGICLLETVISIEMAQDGYKLLTKLNLNALTESARFRVV